MKRGSGFQPAGRVQRTAPTARRRKAQQPDIVANSRWRGR
ncbi:hypothetical protein OH687_00540 [Burkholderia anthina]|nr:hypothetical protein OH687_00540 [Burkholderia anthina]